MGRDPLAGQREAINRGELRPWQDVLSAKQYRSILRGNRPELVWSDSRSVPVKPGDVVVLSVVRGPDAAEDVSEDRRQRVAATHEGERVTLTITRLRRAKLGAVVVEYRVRDDRPLYLAPKAGVTRDRFRSADPDVDVIEADYQRRLSAEANIENEMLRRRQRARAEIIAIERGLNDERKRRAVGGHLRKLRQRAA